MKRITTLFLTVVIVALSFSLSACSSVKKEILGTWITTDMSQITFEDDGTCYKSHTGDPWEDNMILVYSIDGDSLEIVESALGMSQTTKYSFKIEDGVLYLTQKEDGEVIKYYRTKEDFLSKVENVSYEQVEQDLLSYFVDKCGYDKSIFSKKMELSYTDIEQNANDETYQTVHFVWQTDVGVLERTFDDEYVYVYDYDSNKWEKADSPSDYPDYSESYLPSVIGKYSDGFDIMTIHEDYTASMVSEYDGRTYVCDEDIRDMGELKFNEVVDGKRIDYTSYVVVFSYADGKFKYDRGDLLFEKIE